MKAMELKLGDIINFGGKKAKVTSLSSEYQNAIKVLHLEDGDVEGTWIASLLDEIDPIPLTSEILEKNGWEKDIDKYGYTYYQHNGWYRLLIAEQEGSWMFSHYDDFLTTIQSVHELQHILWALGMDDDLKI